MAFGANTQSGIVRSEESRPRPEGYGAKLRDTFTGAQKRRPASAVRAYRENWPFDNTVRTPQLTQLEAEAALIASDACEWCGSLADEACA